MNGPLLFGFIMLLVGWSVGYVFGYARGDREARLRARARARARRATPPTNVRLLRQEGPR